jgi:hypothetical protein
LTQLVYSQNHSTRGDNVVKERVTSAYSSGSPRARLLPPLSSGCDALLEGSVLGLPGPINEKPADQPCTRPGGRTEPCIPANGSKNSPNAGARSGAGKGALLGRGHIGASSERHSDSGEQQ